jgi:AcrR family transcriptional regulator
VASTPRPGRAERREGFIDIAAELVRSEGTTAVTMERVAAISGLSKPVLYRHFDDRGDLLLAVLERCWRDLDRSVAARLRTADTVDESLKALVVGYFDEIAAQGALVRLMVANASREPVVEQARQVRRRAAEAQWSDFYQRRLGLAPDVADAGAAILRSALQGAAEYWIDRPGTPPDEAINTCLAIMRAGLTSLAQQPSDARRPTSPTA